MSYHIFSHVGCFEKAFKSPTSPSDFSLWSLEQQLIHKNLVSHKMTWVIKPVATAVVKRKENDSHKGKVRQHKNSELELIPASNSDLLNPFGVPSPYLIYSLSLHDSLSSFCLSVSWNVLAVNIFIVLMKLCRATWPFVLLVYDNCLASVDIPDRKTQHSIITQF